MKNNSKLFRNNLENLVWKVARFHTVGPDFHPIVHSFRCHVALWSIWRNPASQKYVYGKGIFIALGDFWIFCLIPCQNSRAGSFLKAGCDVKSETSPALYSVPSESIWPVLVGVWTDVLLWHDFVTSCIDLLERTVSSNYAFFRTLTRDYAVFTIFLWT